MTAPLKMTPRAISGLAEIAGDYDVLLCDVWGVIHNGRESFPAACAALERFAVERGPVVLISNSPRPAHDVALQLDALDVPRGAWSAFVTSGDATRVLLKERAPGPAWRIGPERDNVLYEGLGLEFSCPEEAAFIACTGPVNDDWETPEDYRATLAIAAGRGLTMICANPDRVVHRGERLVYCGGALADLYGALGGEVIMAGKPYRPIYDLCLLDAERLLGRAEVRALCIGDGLPTDVKGAQDQGLDCLFVAGGIHGLEVAGQDGRMDPAKVQALLGEADLNAAYAMTTLSW
ncbi:MAG TPA: TIGR01459 family HAD-type hydrolase [Caulobacteraceae bacterium]|jgi:HAD superfamily hydrolase (TIGR01459 family)